MPAATEINEPIYNSDYVIYYHSAKVGNTLTAIATSYGISVNDIIVLNPTAVNGIYYNVDTYKITRDITLKIKVPKDVNEKIQEEKKQIKENQELADSMTGNGNATNSDFASKVDNYVLPTDNSLALNAYDIDTMLSRIEINNINVESNVSEYFDRTLDNIITIDYAFLENNDGNSVSKVGMQEKQYNQFLQYNHYKTLNGIPDYYESGYGYLFFTTPDLNIANKANADKNIESDSFLFNIKKREPHIAESLSTSLDYGASPFIRLLSNNMISFETRDLSMTTISTHETYGGYKTLVPVSFIDSMSGDQFSVSYRESPDLEIMKLHKLWTDYIFQVRRGKFIPSLTTLQNGVFDYMSSVYFFATKPDGRSITYFAKYTGVAPTSIPYSTLSYKNGDHSGDLEFPYSYSFMFKEDLDPGIIKDFKTIMNGTGKIPPEVDIKKMVPRVDRGYGKPKFDYYLTFGSEDYTNNLIRVNSQGYGYMSR